MSHTDIIFFWYHFGQGSKQTEMILEGGVTLQTTDCLVYIFLLELSNADIRIGFNICLCWTHSLVILIQSNALSVLLTVYTNTK